jgi:hypothetical protein
MGTEACRHREEGEGLRRSKEDHRWMAAWEVVTINEGLHHSKGEVALLQGNARRLATIEVSIHEGDPVREVDDQDLGISDHHQ